jgi:signal transduction histidine kinase
LKNLWIIFFWLLGHQLFCQINYGAITALKSEIENAKTDSIRSSKYYVLSDYYLEHYYLDSCFQAITKSFQAAKQGNSAILMEWARHQLGNYYFFQGEFDKAINLQTEVLMKADKFQTPILSACAKNMIAWIYLEMGKNDEALIIFKENLPVFKKYVKIDYRMSVGITYYGIATCYFNEWNLRLAKKHYDSAINVVPKLAERDMALALADRAALYRDGYNDLHSSLKDARDAVSLADYLKRQQDLKAYTYAELALTQAFTGHKIEAEQLAKSAIQAYDQIPLVKRYSSVYSRLANTFIKTGNFRAAYEVEKTRQVLKDSIYKWRKILTIEDLKAKYETEKIKASIEKINRERVEREYIASRKQSVLLVTIFVIVLTSIGIILYYNKREKYLNRIKTLEAKQIVHQEQERIKQELHDSLGGQLSSISMGLNRLAQNSQGNTLRSIQEIADKAIAELRDSLWVMDKESISLGDMEQRVNNLFWQYRKIAIPIELHGAIPDCDKDTKLSARTAGNIYRIIQEATHNAVKHSNAHNFTIKINVEGEQLNLFISDDGIGFEEKDISAQEHYGVENMKLRARQIGAAFTLVTNAERGTTITLKVPVDV